VHENKPQQVITTVRNFLSTESELTDIPGGDYMAQKHSLFKEELSIYCEKLNLQSTTDVQRPSNRDTNLARRKRRLNLGTDRLTSIHANPCTKTPFPGVVFFIARPTFSPWRSPRKPSKRYFSCYFTF
jgi:hypothetical protein